MFRLAEGGKKTRTAFDRIDYKTSRNAGNKMKTMNLPTAVNLLRRQLEEHPGNAGIQRFCKESAFKADIEFADYYPVL